MVKAKYKYKFSNEQLSILNKILNEDKRKKVMSVFQYILKYQSDTSGLLEMSLDRLHKKFNRCHIRMSTTYFKKLANELVEIGLLIVKRKGRFKFYGNKNDVNNRGLEEENNRLKEENERLKEELEGFKEKDITDVSKEKLEEHICKRSNYISDKKLIDENNFIVADRDFVIDTSCDLMKEVKIEVGSIPYLQVIESLHKTMDKKDLHITGMIKYIQKTIEDKIHRQTFFKKKIMKARKVDSDNFYFNNSERYVDYEKLEKQLLAL